MVKMLVLSVAAWPAWQAATSATATATTARTYHHRAKQVRPWKVVQSLSSEREKNIGGNAPKKSKSAPNYVQTESIDSSNSYHGDGNLTDDDSARSNSRNQTRQSPNEPGEFDEDTPTVLEEDVEFLYQRAAERFLSQDIEYSTDTGGGAWPDGDKVDISFDAGCDDNTNDTASASTTDHDGREKSVPGGHQRPNDSGQFEIHTANIFTQNVEGYKRIARDPEGDADFRADHDYTKLETIVDRMEKKNIGAYCIQETWDYGDEFCKDIGRGVLERHRQRILSMASQLRGGGYERSGGETSKAGITTRSRDHSQPGILRRLEGSRLSRAGDLEQEERAWREDHWNHVEVPKD